MDEKTLNKIKMKTMSALPQGAHDGKINIVDVASDLLAEGMNEFVQFDCKFYGKEECREVAYPKSVWQHFKKDYFPEWLLQYFPVQYKTNDFIIRRIYPDLYLGDDSEVIHINSK